jgi:hypothetical protein
MARFVFVVNTNPVEGREDEYNDWYSNRHLADVLALPGVVSARRFAIADTEAAPAPPSFKYLALYEVEADDPRGFFDQMIARAGTDRLPISPALSSTASAVLWKELKSD